MPSTSCLESPREAGYLASLGHVPIWTYQQCRGRVSPDWLSQSHMPIPVARTLGGERGGNLLQIKSVVKITRGSLCVPQLPNHLLCHLFPIFFLLLSSILSFLGQSPLSYSLNDHTDVGETFHDRIGGTLPTGKK